MVGASKRAMTVGSNHVGPKTSSLATPGKLRRPRPSLEGPASAAPACPRGRERQPWYRLAKIDFNAKCLGRCFCESPADHKRRTIVGHTISFCHSLVQTRPIFDNRDIPHSQKSLAVDRTAERWTGPHLASFQHFSPSIEAAVPTDAMRHYRLATVGADRWIDWRQRVVRSTLVFLGMRGASFGCCSLCSAHALVLVRLVATSS